MQHKQESEAWMFSDRIERDENTRGATRAVAAVDEIDDIDVSAHPEVGGVDLIDRSNPSRVPSAARQAMFWADLGRGMAQQRATRDAAVSALLRAEQIAPQRIRPNPFVRETVADLLRRTQRDAVGREPRGMAYRMGIGVG